jgi:hypothetical protein
VHHDARAENRAEALENDKRAGMIGFASHHLAAAPGLVARGDLQSLRHRRERLGQRLRELELCSAAPRFPHPPWRAPCSTPTMTRISTRLARTSLRPPRGDP